MSHLDSVDSPDAAACITGTSRYPVYYEDTDFSGYVYHANYLKFFERAREDLIGLDYLHELYEQGRHYVVSRVELAFIKPGRHGDLIEVRTRMEITTGPACIVEQEAVRLAKEPNEPATTLVKAKIKLVAVNNQGAPTRMPAEVLEHLRQRVGSPSP